MGNVTSAHLHNIAGEIALSMGGSVVLLLIINGLTPLRRHQIVNLELRKRHHIFFRILKHVALLTI